MITPTKEDIGRKVKFRRSDGKYEHGVLRTVRGSVSIVDFDQRRRDAIVANAALEWVVSLEMQPMRRAGDPRSAGSVPGPALSAAIVKG